MALPMQREVQSYIRLLHLSGRQTDADGLDRTRSRILCSAISGAGGSVNQDSHREPDLTED